MKVKSEIVNHEDCDYGDLFWHTDQNEFYVLTGNPLEIETLCGQFFEKSDGVCVRVEVSE